MQTLKMDFNKDKAVGDSGEIAVSYLIKSMPNWKCFKFGIENHIEILKEAIRKSINPITKKIKSMPDFVAFNQKTGETFFIEVKYRSNSKDGKYLFNYLNKYNEYWKGTKLIIVHPTDPHFIYIDLEKIRDKMRNTIKIEQENTWKEQWNFKGIEQDIKILFPELSKEGIQTAINLIPKGG